MSLFQFQQQVVQKAYMNFRQAVLVRRQTNIDGQQGGDGVLQNRNKRPYSSVNKSLFLY